MKKERKQTKKETMGTSSIHSVLCLEKILEKQWIRSENQKMLKIVKIYVSQSGMVLLLWIEKKNPHSLLEDSPAFQIVVSYCQIFKLNYI